MGHQLNKYSKNITQPKKQGASQAMLYGTGMTREDSHDIVGMVLSYPSSYHKITDEMRSFIPADRLDYFSHYFSTH